MKNVQEKNKSPLDHPCNDGERKSAKWEDSTIELLIDCTIEQANFGEQTGSGLTSTGWRKAKAKFKIVNEMSLDDVQIKNKWENIKNGKHGWNPEKNNFEALAEWWEIKNEQPEAKQFKKKSLKFNEKLTSMFAPGTTTGELAWVPSSGVLPNNVQNSDSYEGSGESEDPNIGASTMGGDPSVGCTNEFENFKFNNSEGSSLSGRKRKNDGSMLGKESKKIQHKKMTNYLDKILGAVQSRTRGSINDINEDLSDPYSIANVIRDVKKLPGMEPGSKLLAQSSHVLRDIELRKLYVAQGDEDSKLSFLLYEIDILRG
ncbi:hypothetical protein Lal_00012512 [Lupinus albus]|nr:hypothetical protein Lal_00012512 [Lupinus albus]